MPSVLQFDWLRGLEMSRLSDFVLVEQLLKEKEKKRGARSTLHLLEAHQFQGSNFRDIQRRRSPRPYLSPRKRLNSSS